ncbi:isocitrate lyase/PEP mutase family protein [Nocardioides plantarum]|uniref:Oxaloacetate decarboxylase n=1 Tax=Nocardioides plantarum TaxID=29299 RepID=A0ABV5KGD7_9ACTN|nr:isocitrate lyase/PEP mutase family protein [Nocardioides plantarum]
MARLSLPELLAQDGVIHAPGVWDGLSARLADQAGFSAVCASGFAIAAGLGMPDAEVFTATEGVNAVRMIHEATDLPIIADIDTGYGNAINAGRTAASMRRAGVSAVFMEDQVSPKRCPICVGDPVELTPLVEAAGKVRAAKDGLGSDALLIARTDAVGDEALKRAEAYVAAGADLIMPVSKTFSSLEEWQRCHELTGVPLVASLTAWTWVEREFTNEAMEQAGIKVAMVATHGILAAATAIRDSFTRLAAGEPLPDVSGRYMEHEDFVQMIGFPEMEERQRTYLPAAEEI